MSSGDPIPYAEALPVAEELRDLLAPACDQIVIAGSLRRQRPTVSDIEIVAQPRYEELADGLFDTARVSALDALLGSFTRRPVTLRRADGSEEVQTRDGAAYKALLYRGLPVDLFIVDPQHADWGVILTIRTGPADFSRELVTRCRTWGRRVQGGRLYVRGQYQPCPTEREFLAAVGMPWLEPEERAPERLKLMMGGMPVSTLSPSYQLAESYGALSDLLDAGEHDRACAFRCLRPDCRDDHHCYVCQTWADAEEGDLAGPSAERRRGVSR